MAGRLVPERVQLVIEKREPFALTHPLAIDAPRRNPRELGLAQFIAPVALDASACSAEPHANPGCLEGVRPVSSEFPLRSPECLKQEPRRHCSVGDGSLQKRASLPLSRTKAALRRVRRESSAARFPQHPRPASAASACQSLTLSGHRPRAPGLVFGVEVDSEAFEQLRLLGLELFQREKTLIA